jgi:isoamyl acetate esterase
LASALRNWEVINAGVPGNNTNDALMRIEKDVLKYRPDIVTVLFGANDTAFHKIVDLHTYKENQYLITCLIGPSKTILITPSPVDESIQHARTNKVLKGYADAVKQVSRLTGSHLINFFTEVITRENYQTILYGERNDGLHFGEAGYEILAK